MHEQERGRMSERSGRRTETTMPEPQPESAGRDIDELRLDLAHRLNIHASNQRALWRTCEYTACSRARSCVAPGGKCPHLPPPPDDPQKFAEVAAKIKKALERRYQALLREEERAARRAAAPKAPSARRGRSGRARDG
jgi:hypothetical protein